MLQVLSLCLTSLQSPTFSLNTVYMNIYLHCDTSHWLLTRVSVDQDRNSPPCLGEKSCQESIFDPFQLQQKTYLYYRYLLVHFNTISTFDTTRSYAALRAADLDWIIGPGYSSGGYILGENHEKPTWNHEKPGITEKRH